MADFSRFFPILLKHEGGYVNHPADPGGATNKGITLGTLSQCSRALLGLPPSMGLLRDLTDEQVGIIYKALYWDAIRGDDIASQSLASLVCDFQVNAGATSSRLLQMVLNEHGTRPALAIDGVIGSRTLRVVNACDAARIHAMFKTRRVDYYRGLAKRRPSLQCFLAGWLRRTESFAYISP
ncbi:N-acetylmuramidase [Luteibacter sp. OK325]|uniref:glycoside hydrolase family 108 protein n=1 Tax=Luteibacter sp. OK325 TaxID=2135670 RepID=UPI000D3D8D30|nr:N-acetylmuramidase [Luteibacter sp. OK325]